MQKLISILTKKIALSSKHIENIISLLEGGATIPFIARYRKELTGGASDEVLREFGEIYDYHKKLLSRKDEIREILKSKELLSLKLDKEIEDAQTLVSLEDIYRPFKEKRNSRASRAIKNGLSDLANTLQKASLSKSEFEKEAKKFLSKNIISIEDAIKGAQDIIAERYSDMAKEREVLRNLTLSHGVLEVKKAKDYKDDGLFSHYNNFSQKVSTIPSHRYLAIMRGVSEKELSVKISIDMDKIYENIYKYRLKAHMQSSKEFLFEAYKDGLKRLLYPSIEREVQAILKERSDRAAISVFGKNLTQLLMTPPVVGRVFLGVDPAFRTGCKLAVIDENGQYLDHSVIYPTAPRNDYESSKKIVLNLIKKYNISGVAIGNGTASRETQEFFAKINREGDSKISYTVVSEAGASVYSASKVAQDEYPNLDVTIRGAISIASRLRDPMAELVKIDPKSLGIGQYQHSVDQKLLSKKLHDEVENLVNRVGVDLNSASASLLSFVAGVGPKLAKSILSFRDENGAFRTKNELLKVKGLGNKAYEQCAGFMRIRDGKVVYDNTGIHPESYKVAKKLEQYDDNMPISKVANELNVGIETLRDIKKELQKLGFDPRENLPSIPFRDDVTDIKTLKEGSFVSGVVRNISDFGAFVDIGLKNDGLIHISKISQKRVSHPLEVLQINQYLPRIEVIGVDSDKGRVSLSIKDN
jgi:uncharacterized protein